SSVGEAPSSITYDGTRDRLYVMLKQAIVAVDPSTLRTIDRWEAPQPFDPNGAMALDARGGRLYVPQPQGVTALALDKPQLMATNTYMLGAAPGGLALSPDGAALFALDPQQARLWTIDISGGSATSQVLAPARTRNGWLATSQDGQSVYVLLTGAAAGDRPALWRVDRRGQAGAPAALAQAPPPWDMELTRAGQLAIARGDGTRGGIELLDPTTLTTTARLDPDYDQHHAVVGPDGALFGLNFTHRTATRFDAGAHTVVWRTPEDSGWQPWDGVLVPGGWRWPW
ncbi:MAG TPA: hypothetical protein VF897_02455, partial [Roseiflexaceae bacterium]